MFYGCPENFNCSNTICVNLLETIIWEWMVARSDLADMQMDFVLGCDENGNIISADSIRMMEEYIEERRAIIDAFER